LLTIIAFLKTTEEMTARNILTVMEQLVTQPSNLNCCFKERQNHQMDFFKGYKSPSPSGCTADCLFACGEQITVITQTKSSSHRVGGHYAVQGHSKGH